MNRKEIARSVLQEEKGSSTILKMVILFLIIMLLFFIYWSREVQLTEIVNTKGVIESEEDIVNIQHNSGGMISEITIGERDEVKKGDLLVRLDNTILNLQIEEEQLNINSLVQQRNLLNQELAIQEELYAQKLTTITDYLSIQRKISEVKGQISIAVKRIERYRILQEQSDIYSPIDGIIHNLNQKAKGSVIRSGETILSIIPANIHYRAVVQIPAERIGSIKTGQTVVLKFSSYSYSLFGGKTAILSEISPTTFLDAREQPYYEGIVSLEGNLMDSGDESMPILQGMTLTGEIKTGSKTLFEYLFIPVKASVQTAFNEP